MLRVHAFSLSPKIPSGGRLSPPVIVLSECATGGPGTATGPCSHMDHPSH